MPILALGAVFSALEVVPLTLLGFEVVHNLSVVREGGHAYAYKWPVYFFISVAFWNLVGAGIFGFLINPPIVLYYIQGINTTPIHSHTALFGVYGLLAISLLLFSVRHIVTRQSWSDKLLKYSFWGLNGGLCGHGGFSPEIPALQDFYLVFAAGARCGLPKCDFPARFMVLGFWFNAIKRFNEPGNCQITPGRPR
jgi:nitric oxide reductase large subunit